MFTSEIKSSVFFWLPAAGPVSLTRLPPEPEGVRIQAFTGGGDQTEPTDPRSLAGASSRGWRLMELFASCLFCFVFCRATGHQQWLNVLPGKRAAAVVLGAGAHRHLCAALGTGQAEELVFRPERAARKVSLDPFVLKEGGKRDRKTTVKLSVCFPTEKQKIWGKC